MPAEGRPETGNLYRGYGAAESRTHSPFLHPAKQFVAVSWAIPDANHILPKIVLTTSPGDMGSKTQKLSENSGGKKSLFPALEAECNSSALPDRYPISKFPVRV